MAVPLCKLEGTWQEIAARIPNFDTRKLQVVIYDAEGTQPIIPAVKSETTLDVEPQKTLAEVLREIEERSRFMNPKPDARDYLREARSGAMFGLDGHE